MQGDKAQDEEKIRKKIEAVLFACGKAIKEEEIAKICNIRMGHDVGKSLQVIQQDYEQRLSPIMIVQEGKAWKMTIRERYLSLVQQINPHTELPGSIMETLAVIAWKSPVMQSEIVKIRSNKAYDHVKELVDLGFITKDKHGRSFLIKTSQKFYDYFELAGRQGVKEIFGKIQGIEALEGKQRNIHEFSLPPDKGGILGGLEIYDYSDAKNASKLDPYRIQFYDILGRTDVAEQEKERFNFDVRGSEEVSITPPGSSRDDDNISSGDELSLNAMQHEQQDSSDQAEDKEDNENSFPADSAEGIGTEEKKQDVPQEHKPQKSQNMENNSAEENSSNKIVEIEEPSPFSSVKTESEKITRKSLEESTEDTLADARISSMTKPEFYDPDQIEKVKEIEEVYTRVHEIEKEVDKEAPIETEDNPEDDASEENDDGKINGIHLGADPIGQARYELEGVKFDKREKELYNELVHGNKELSFLSDEQGKEKKKEVRYKEEEEIEDAVKDIVENTAAGVQMSEEDENRVDELLKSRNLESEETGDSGLDSQEDSEVQKEETEPEEQEKEEANR